MTQTLGTFLRHLFRSKGVTLKWLAREAGISRATLYRWLRGEYLPNLYELEQVLIALDATAAERRQALQRIDAPRAVIQLRREEHNGNLPSQPFAGDLLRAMRLRQGMTLDETARALGVQRSTVHRWERSETVPSTEKLQALCSLLKASPGELQALSVGCTHLAPSPEAEPLTLDHIEHDHRSIQEQITAGDNALMDLRLLSLEARTCQLAHDDLEARRRLAVIYSTHARWLMMQGRFFEAENYAYRALGTVQNDFEPEPFWLLAVRIMAKGAAEWSRYPNPQNGIEVLENWLPVAAFWHEMEAWFLRDMAIYHAEIGDDTSAIRLCEQAYQIVERHCSPDEMYHIRFDYAHVLLKAGQAPQALSMLPDVSHRVPFQRVHHAILSAEIQLALDDPASMQEWLDIAYQIIEANDLWRLKPQVDAVLVPP
jgi:transcriptional regulator with XRE-family HTH domain